MPNDTRVQNTTIEGLNVEALRSVYDHASDAAGRLSHHLPAPPPLTLTLDQALSLAALLFRVLPRDR